MTDAFEFFFDDETPLQAGADLAAAVVAFRARPEAAGYARLAVPLGRLQELALVPPGEGEPIPVTVIAPHTLIKEDWEDMLEDAAAQLNAFVKTAGDEGYEVEAFEARVPDLDNLADYVADLKGFDDAEIFVEMPSRDGVGEALAALAEETEWAGAKFPGTDSRLPEFLKGAFDLEIPFKLVGGDAPKLLDAIAVAMADDLSTPEIEAILDRGGRTPTDEEREDARALFLALGTA